jgi:hypothetical protein
MRNALGQLVGTFNKSWVTPLGGGGFVTSIALAAKAGKTVMMTANDVTLGYTRTFGDKTWQKTFNLSNFPAGEHTPIPPYAPRAGFGRTSDVGTGFYAVRFAPSNPDFRVASFNNRIWFTENGGTSWARASGFPAIYMHANADYQRTCQSTLAIHPSNTSVWLVGTSNDGVWATTNKGVSATELTGIPTNITEASNPNRKHFVASDPTDGNIWYAYSHTNGIYRSTTGVTGTYTLMSGSPTNIMQMAVCPTTGDLFVNAWYTVAGNKLSYYDKSANTWVTCLNTSQSKTFAIDPFDANHIVCIGENGEGPFRSLDKGATAFVDYTDVLRGPGEIPWYSNSDKAVFAAELNFDPVVARRLWVSEGLGVGYVDLPVSNTASWPWRWLDYSAGIEMLIQFDSFYNPAKNRMVHLCWDKPFWDMTDEVNYTNTPGNPVNSSNPLKIGQGWDYAIDNPDWQVLSCSPPNTSQAIGWRNGYGLWQSFANEPVMADPRGIADKTFACNGVTNTFPIVPADGFRFVGLQNSIVHLIDGDGNETLLQHYYGGPSKQYDFVRVASSTQEGHITVTAGPPPAGHTLRVRQDWPAGLFGPVAVSNQGQVLMQLSNNGPLVYTDNGGATPWQFVQIGAENPLINNHSAYYVKRRNICADKSVPGDFYLIVNMLSQTTADALTRPTGGLWRLRRQSNGTLQATQLAPGVIVGSGAMFWQAKLECVPGFPGEVCFSNPLRRVDQNTDYLLAWWDGTQVREINSNLRGVAGFAFGKAALGQSRPALAVYCYFGPQGEGLYVTLDWGQTLTYVGKNLHGELVEQMNVAGHMGIFGRFYVDTDSSGLRTLQYHKRFACVPS